MIEVNARYYMKHDYENEIWKVVKGFDNYLISNYSRIKRIDNNLIMKPEIITSGIKTTYYIKLSSEHGRSKFNIDDIVINAGFKTISKITQEKELIYRKSSEFIYDCF